MSSGSLSSVYSDAITLRSTIITILQYSDVSFSVIRVGILSRYLWPDVSMQLVSKASLPTSISLITIS